MSWLGLLGIIKRKIRQHFANFKRPIAFFPERVRQEINRMKNYKWFYIVMQWRIIRGRYIDTKIE